MLVATTTVTITRPLGTGDPYETPSSSDVTSGVPAHISAPTGNDARVGGDRETVTAVAYLPAATIIDRTSIVTDAATGDTYGVVWTRPRRGLGLDHVVAGLVATKGAAA